MVEEIIVILVERQSNTSESNSASESGELPRLTYLGDVPVEASYHGSALLYRLLEDYPKDRLTIVEAGTQPSLAERRISDIEYRSLRLPIERIARSRFWKLYQSVALRSAKARASFLVPSIMKRSPEAILTVSHGYSWITAAEIARQIDVPLHLICHDEWARVGDMQKWKDKLFSDIYRRAASRLCVSPFMAEENKRRYGVSSDVLYPSRARGNPTYSAPPRVDETRPLTGAFAGAALHDTGNQEVVARIANAIGRVGGVLEIYGPYTAADLPSLRLPHGNVRAAGLLKSAELIEELRQKADFLIAPMSFLNSDRESVSNSFPSKMTDYTAAALPILAVAPPYSSLANWCRLEPDGAVLVDEEDEDQIEAAIRRLSDFSVREIKGRAAAAAGARYFGPHAATAGLYSKLLAALDG